MKKQYIIIALGAMLMASCADEFDRHFEVGRPDKTEKYASLTPISIWVSVLMPKTMPSRVYPMW